MAEVKDITIQETPLIPAEVVENATTQSKLLMDIVEKTKCYQAIKGKKYLQVEAWETIGAFNGIHAETKEIKPIGKDGETIGYEAHVQLVRHGVVVGGAVMPCYFSENCCRGKQGDDRHKACMSAAQTFATSKAYRMNFSYVAILAGYQPLPAEEVSEDMSGNGHTETPILAKYESADTPVDMGWVNESIKALKWADVASYISEHFPKAKGATVGEAIRSLPQDQQAQFTAELQKRLSAKAK